MPFPAGEEMESDTQRGEDLSFTESYQLRGSPVAPGTSLPVDSHLIHGV